MTSTVLIFSVVAGIIVVGFAGDQFFKKTGVPIFVFLILMGILIGPVLDIFPRASLIPALGVFAELTLLMVLFYGGMDTKASAALKGGGRAFLQVTAYVIGSTLAIAAAATVFFRWDLIQSLIFSSMIGGETTAAVVVPLSRSLKLSEATVAFLTLESVMNSIFSIILFFAFVGVYETGVGNLTAALTDIAAKFSVGIVLGGVLSIFWVFILEYYQRQKYTYVLTLGLVFVTYGVSTNLGGSGELSVLIFGLVLGNYQLQNYVSKRQLNMDALMTQLETIQDELSFLLNTLFFVFLGLTFEIVPSLILSNLFAGIVVVCLLLLFRLGATRLSTRKSGFAADRDVIWLMCAQGLTPATLAIVAANLAIPLSGTFLNIVTYVIILTNIVTTAGVVWRLHRQRQGFKEFTESLNEGYRLH